MLVFIFTTYFGDKIGTRGTRFHGDQLVVDNTIDTNYRFRNEMFLFTAADTIVFGMNAMLVRLIKDTT